MHVILDNYAAHKHPRVRQWLDRHPRFTFHFTPTSCSWLNAVEGFFAKLAKRRLKRGVFRCVVDLQATINRFVAETNHDPKPFTWTADPDKIIAAVRRGHQVLIRSTSFAAPRNSIPICRLYNAVQKIYRSGTDARGGSLSVGRDNRRIIIAAVAIVSVRRSPTRREAGQAKANAKPSVARNM